MTHGAAGRAQAPVLDAIALRGAGGVQRLLAHEPQLRDACVLPDAVGLLSQTWPQLSAADRDAATGFVVRAVSDFDPLQADDVLEVLLLAPTLLPDVAGPLRARLAAAARPDPEKVSYAASAAGEALVLLAMAGYGRVTNATGLLLEQVDALAQDSAHGQHAHDEHEEAARRLTRALGLARQKWGDPSGEIVPALESLAHAHSEIADDAAMELGLAGVAAALSSRTETESLNHLRDALVWFQTSRDSVEGRHDAELLVVALHAVLTFAHGGKISTQTVVELRTRVLDWVHGGLDEEPQWRGRRADALLAWFDLVDRLSQCAELGVTHWWEPPSLIASIGKAVIAQHAVLVATLPNTPHDDVTGPPVMERMLAPFLEVADKRAWLDRWLEHEADDDPDAAEGIRRFRDLLDTPPSAHDPPGKDAGRPHDVVRDALALDNATAAEVLESLPPRLLGKIYLAVEGQNRVYATTRGLTYEKIYRDVTGKLADCPDYHGDVQAAGNLIIGELLAFTKQRLDDETHAASPAHYLRKLSPNDKDPLESALANDLHNHLQRTLGGQILQEVPNIGGGRIDLVWIWPEFRLVVECKRRKRGERSPNMEAKLAQAEQYQVTDVPIGALVILDLTDKGHLIDLESCVSVEVLQAVDGGTIDHYVTVFIVQGNKPAPSSSRRPMLT